MGQLYRVLQPQYYDGFACTGSDCSDSCCRGWTIFIDKDTYNHYRQIKDPDMAELVRKYVKRIRDDSQDNYKYAQIMFRDDGMCGFVSPEGLCILQKQYGPKYLSKVCMIYPRLITNFNGLIERSMHFSCPELTQTAMLERKPMEFNLSEVELEPTHLAHNTAHQFTTDALAEKQPWAACLWDIRSACIDIMQTRTLAIDERIFLIGMLLNKIDEADKAGEIDGIPELIEKYVALGKSGEFRGALDRMTQSDDQRYLLNELIFNNILPRIRIHRVDNNALLTIMTSILDEGEEERNVTWADMHTHISSGIEKYYKPFVSGHAHVLENYFVNWIFSNVFPYLFNERSPLENFAVLAAHYALVRMTLASYGIKNDRLDEKLAAGSIALLARSLEHGMFGTEVAKALTKEHSDLAHLSFLVRD